MKDWFMITRYRPQSEYPTAPNKYSLPTTDSLKTITISTDNNILYRYFSSFATDPKMARQSITHAGCYDIGKSYNRAMLGTVKSTILLFSHQKDHESSLVSLQRLVKFESRPTCETLCVGGRPWVFPRPIFAPSSIFWVGGWRPCSPRFKVRAVISYSYR